VITWIPLAWGIFGFSLGGFTEMVVSGGKPDLSRMLELCSTRPTAPECVFVKQRGGDQLQPVAGNTKWPHDPRVKAAEMQRHRLRLRRMRDCKCSWLE
jgi:predicted dienelactone hydrolase